VAPASTLTRRDGGSAVLGDTLKLQDGSHDARAAMSLHIPSG
jgi:hypothetical protein